MEKKITVYVVATETHSQVYPTKAQATLVVNMLNSFGESPVMTQEKRTVTIN